jgi:hypothetical protein
LGGSANATAVIAQTKNAVSAIVVIDRRKPALSLRSMAIKYSPVVNHSCAARFE